MTLLKQDFEKPSTDLTLQPKLPPMQYLSESRKARISWACILLIAATALESIFGHRDRRRYSREDNAELASPHIFLLYFVTKKEDRGF